MDNNEKKRKHSVAVTNKLLETLRTIVQATQTLETIIQENACENLDLSSLIPYTRHINNGLSPPTLIRLPPSRSSSSKSKKDPNAPKQPMTSYLLYCADVRATIKNQHPELTQREIASEMGRRWKELTPDIKKNYDEQALLRREAYNIAVKDYRSKTSPITPTPPSNPNSNLQFANHIYMPYQNDQQQQQQQQQQPQHVTKRARTNGYHVEQDGEE